MELTVRMKVDRQTMEDIFVTAIEGGSNYWCELDEPSNKTLKEYRNEPFSLVVVKAVYYHGEKINVFDVEDDDEFKQAIGVLDRDMFERRLQKLVDDGNGEQLIAHLHDASACDASDADLIFQYLIFGEAVYG